MQGMGMDNSYQGVGRAYAQESVPLNHSSRRSTHALALRKREDEVRGAAGRTWSPVYHPRMKQHVSIDSNTSPPAPLRTSSLWTLAECRRRDTLPCMFG